MESKLFLKKQPVNMLPFSDTTLRLSRSALLATSIMACLLTISCRMNWMFCTASLKDCSSSTEYTTRMASTSGRSSMAFKRDFISSFENCLQLSSFYCYHDTKNVTFYFILTQFTFHLNKRAVFMPYLNI